MVVTQPFGADLGDSCTGLNFYKIINNKNVFVR